MTPTRPMVIDNRAPAPVFLEGSPITDGLANLFASAINAPIAAGQVRRQREQDDRQQTMRDQAMQRQAMLDDRAVQWYNQEQATRGRDTGMQVARQNRQDALEAEWRRAQMKNTERDSARKMAEMFGSGLNNAAARGIDAYKAMFQRGGSAGADARPAKPEVRNFGSDFEPNWRQWDGAQWVDPPMPAPAVDDTETEEQRRARLMKETGFPDGEFNWYNPADWFRSAPSGAPATGDNAGQSTAAPPALAALKRYGIDETGTFAPLLPALAANDPAERAKALLAMPATWRKRAIAALRESGVR